MPFAAPEHRPFVLGSGPRKLLLVHGFPGTPAEVRAVAEALAPLGFEAHGPLLPGFGPDIERVGDTRWPDWEGAVMARYRELEGSGDEVTLIGFSMGGALALRAAAALRPRRLVLIAPFSGFSDRRAALLPLLRFVVPKVRPFADSDFSDPAVRRSVRRILAETDLDDPGVVAQLRRDITLPTRSLEELRRLGAAVRRTAPRVSSETLVVQGSDDTTVDPTSTRALASRLGGPSRFEEIAGPHTLVLPTGPHFDDLVALLQSFLRD